MARPIKSEADRKDETVAVRIPNPDYERLVAFCEAQGVRMSILMRHIVHTFLEENQ